MSRMTITPSVGGNDGDEINAASVLVKTAAGSFHIGVDNYGQPYIASGNHQRLQVIPCASNRINVGLVD